jgi:hypothetical protein
LLISRAPSSEDDTSSSEEEEDDEPATKAYRLTNAEDWHRIINDDDIRVVEPIPFTGGVDGEEQFTVKISDEELASLMDDSGDIRFPKVFEWLLPRYGDDGFWEFLAARMRNYMIHIMSAEEKPYKPRHGKWVTVDESRVAGWYHSCITIGPEPKPIRTGATIHSLCVTHGSCVPQ